MQDKNVFEPVDLTPELQRQSRLDDLKWMKDHEHEFAYPTYKQELDGDDNLLATLNIRFMQYKQQMQVYSMQFRAFQTISDFKRYLIPLQAKTLDEQKPIALVKQTQEKIYFAGMMFVIRE